MFNLVDFIKNNKVEVVYLCIIAGSIAGSIVYTLHTMWVGNIKSKYELEISRLTSKHESKTKGLIEKNKSLESKYAKIDKELKSKEELVEKYKKQAKEAIDGQNSLQKESEKAKITKGLIPLDFLDDSEESQIKITSGAQWIGVKIPHKILDGNVIVTFEDIFEYHRKTTVKVIIDVPKRKPYRKKLHTGKSLIFTYDDQQYALNLIEAKLQEERAKFSITKK